MFIVGYGVRDFPASEFCLHLDDFRKPAADTRPAAKAVMASLMRRVLLAGTERIVFYITARWADDQHIFAHFLKRSFSDCEVLVSGPGMRFGSAISQLKSGYVDRVVRATSPEELLERLTAPADRQRPNGVLQKGATGHVEWVFAPPPREGAGERTLLVLMPAWNNDFPPYGLAHIAAALRAAGHIVDVLDLNLEFWRVLSQRSTDRTRFSDAQVWFTWDRYQAEARPQLEPLFVQLEQRLRAGRYQHVGFSLFHTNLYPSEEAFAQVRQVLPAARIFCGGPSCEKEWAEPALAQGKIDAAVFGEGEHSVVDLLAAWGRGENRPIPGTYRGDSGIVLKGGTRSLGNINELPLPDFSGFYVYDYDHATLPLHFSRGCVASCAFCTETRYWVRFRILAAQKILERMKRAIEDFGITDFQFNDSLMNGSHRHLEALVDMILAERLKVTFTGYCRLEPDLSGPLLEKLGRAGCRNISFGMESGSQKVTDLMRKEVDVRNYPTIIKNVHKAGIAATVCVMVGFPGENWREFARTLFTVVRLRRYITVLNLNILSPGELYKDPEAMRVHGVQRRQSWDDWSTSDGRNTKKVRRTRFWLLSRAWHWMKKAEVSPLNWKYEQTQGL